MAKASNNELPRDSGRVATLAKAINNELPRDSWRVASFQFKEKLCVLCGSSAVIA